jgi:hypothetical protein
MSENGRLGDVTEFLAGEFGGCLVEWPTQLRVPNYIVPPHQRLLLLLLLVLLVVVVVVATGSAIGGWVAERSRVGRERFCTREACPAVSLTLRFLSEPDHIRGCWCHWCCCRW